ncbi:MAG: hypothetical protein F6K14_26745 [Symploca sp. SIO2C1]|nr:hypothetical protein [Symploca sp. SIO2C1]
MDYELEPTKQQPVIAQTVSLGHNFPPISTQYELRHKNLEGKTFWDLLPQLQEPFAPEEHKNYELGYSKEHQSKIDYVYVPWQAYEDRLNDVVGRGFWLQETVGTWIDESGRPVVRSRLSVLGVVFEANGYAKPRGQWKGSLMEVAEKDALKECCERLTGMGRYFRDQLWTINYVYQNTSDPDQKGEMRRLIGQRKKTSGAAAIRSRQHLKNQRQDSGLLDAMAGDLPKHKPVSQPKPKPQPQQPQQAKQDNVVSLSLIKGSHPEHNKIVKTVRSITGHKPDVIVNWCKQYGNASLPSELSPELAYQLLISLVAGWLQDAKGLSSEVALKTLKTKISYLTQNQGINYLESVAIALDELQQLDPKEVIQGGNN